jgi:hypothetical protein
MNEDTQRDMILVELAKLNHNVERQLSVGRMFFVGIIYGIGFFVGSAIIATLALGILTPIFGKIPFIHDIFTQGNMFGR